MGNSGIRSPSESGLVASTPGEKIESCRTIPTPNILVVDDDAGLRETLRLGLEAAGYAVEESSDGPSALNKTAALPIALVTLDIGLGDDDGLALIHRLKAIRDIPIIMVTAHGAPEERLEGLTTGADDYVVKPFRVGEIVLRIKALLTRWRPPAALASQSSPQYAFEGGVLDVKRRQLMRPGGEVVDLTETEYEILKIFLEDAGNAISRDRIARTLRGRDWSPTDRTIDGHIARLKRKIQPQGAAELIHSVRGIGYRFAGHVELR